MEANPLFRKHSAADDRGTAARSGAGLSQFSGTRLPSHVTRVPLRLRQRSVRRFDRDSAKVPGHSEPLGIVGFLSPVEPVAVVARLIAMQRQVRNGLIYSRV